MAKLDEILPAQLAGGGGADGLGFDIDWRVGKMLGRTPTKVGRCRSTVSKPELNARLMSATFAPAALYHMDHFGSQSPISP